MNRQDTSNATSIDDAATHTPNVWTYPNGLGRSVIADLVGYQVVATDGEIGHIDQATDQVANSTAGAAIVVDTGFWIFGKKRMIPAGVIDMIDAEQRTVQVKMTKDQLKHAPDYLEGAADSAATSEAHDEHRAQVTDYYSRWWA